MNNNPRANHTAKPKTSTTTADARRTNNTGLPNSLKSGIEQLSGMRMDNVKVHYNSAKPATVQAHAMAQGSTVHLAAPQEKHIKHEAAHVVQQTQGRVGPTTSVASVSINDSASLEAEATSFGKLANKGRNT